MNSYLQLTGTSLRRRPSLFPEIRSPSAARGPPAPTPSTSPAPTPSTPADPPRADPDEPSPNYPESARPIRAHEQHPRSVANCRSPRGPRWPETQGYTFPETCSQCLPFIPGDSTGYPVREEPGGSLSTSVIPRVATGLLIVVTRVTDM